MKQKRRLRQVKQVCDSYKSDEVFKQMYIDKPGSRIRGKFTFERRSKLVFCNIMKQGLLRWAKRWHFCEITLCRHHNLGQNIPPTNSSSSCQLEIKQVSTIFSIQSWISREGFKIVTQWNLSKDEIWLYIYFYAFLVISSHKTSFMKNSIKLFFLKPSSSEAERVSKQEIFTERKKADCRVTGARESPVFCILCLQESDWTIKITLLLLSGSGEIQRRKQT